MDETQEREWKLKEGTGGGERKGGKGKKLKDIEAEKRDMWRWRRNKRNERER